MYSKAEIKKYYHHISDAVILTDAKYKILYRNESAEHWFAAENNLNALLAETDNILFHDLLAKKSESNTIHFINMIGISGDPMGVEIHWQDINESGTAEKLFLIRRKLDTTLGANLYNIIDNFQGGIFILDDQFRVIYINTNLSRMFGDDKDIIIGQDFRAFLSPESLEKAIRNYQERQKGKNVPAFYEIKVTNKDGEEIDAEISATAIHSQDGHILTICQMIDITERKKAIKKLKESEKRLHTLFERAPDAYYIMDSNGVFLDGNIAAEKLIGYDRKEIVGKSFVEADIVHPDDLQEVHRILIQSLTGKSSGPEEIRIKSRDGRFVTTEIQSVPYHLDNELMILGIARDIEARKKTERELRYRTEFKKLVTSISADLINLPFKEIYSGIQSALKKIGAFLLVDRVFILEYTNDFQMVSCTAEWHRSGLSPKKKILQNVPVSQMRWWHQRMSNGQIQAITNINDLPEEHFAREIYKTLSIQSSLEVPLSCSGLLIGALGLLSHEEKREWRKDDIDILRMAGEMFANVLSRNRVVEELKISEEKYRDLIQNATMGIMVFQNDKMVFHNPYAAQVLELDPARNHQLHLNLIIHPEDRNLVLERHRGRIAGNQYPHQYSVRIIAMSGTTKWVELNSVVVNWMGKPATLVFANDITHQRKTENELAQLASVIEQEEDAVAITDLTGTIIYVNPAFQKVSGYGAQEVIGQNFTLLKSGEHDETFYKKMWKTILSGNPWRGVIINRKKDGSHFYENSLIFPIKNRKGEITNFATIKRDITEELKVEQQIQQAQRLEAVGQMSSSVAHDFNNILGAIIGFAELGLTGSGDSEKTGHYLNEIVKASRRGETLTRQLLEFSKRQKRTPEPVQVNEIIKDISKMLQQLSGFHIEFKTKLAANLPIIKADPGQIEQILVNLIVNAKDAINAKTEKNGVQSILLKTGMEQSDPSLLAPEHKENQYIFFSVEDTGTGIDEKIQPKIFDPFFTTKDRGKGTGLGLSTIFGIVNQNGGYVTLESEAGKGSIFKVYWPVLESGDTQETGMVGDKTQAQRVLFVEDDAGIRDLVIESLQIAGYEVDVAESGRQAQTFLQNGNRYALLFTDMVLPDSNGRDLAEQFIVKNPESKILYTSGYGEEYVFKNGNRKEFEHFIQKPYNIIGLNDQIGEILSN